MSPDRMIAVHAQSKTRPDNTTHATLTTTQNWHACKLQCLGMAPINVTTINYPVEAQPRRRYCLALAVHTLAGFGQQQVWRPGRVQLQT